MAPPAPTIVGSDGVQALLDLLHGDGWTVMGPTVRDGVIGIAPVRLVDELPRGVGDEQDGACYRLRERGDNALFGFVVGPQSWKSLLFPARERLRRSNSDGKTSEDPTPLALFGVRSCDLHAIAIHDRVLRDRPVAADAHYTARREATFIVAVTCADPGGTCFCASMDTGPDPSEGFDLALTELLDAGRHRFLVRSGSLRGADVLDRLPAAPATETDHTAATAVVASAVSRMGRHLDTTDIRDLLHANAEHPQWDDVGNRCLACSNCTLVCPTCFCTSIEDSSDLADGSSERWRVWDSCFTSDFSHLHGGSVRTSTKSRYRQWATHKLASWWDQFGTSGCVGCGRCITWCPVAIDLTAEVAAIRATAPPPPDDPTEDGV